MQKEIIVKCWRQLHNCIILQVQIHIVLSFLTDESPKIVEGRVETIEHHEMCALLGLKDRNARAKVQRLVKPKERPH
jgi:hypothetical protein